MTDEQEKPPAAIRFEIFYSDDTIARGETVAEFERAKSVGVQFVVIEYADQSIVKHKGLDLYQFNGATKPGDWTDRQTYDRIKNDLAARSTILQPRYEPRRRGGGRRGIE